MAVDPKFYVVEKDGPVVIWKFNNPPQNLMNLHTAAEFTDLVEEFEADPDLRVGILTSNLPDVFIQHFDVSTILSEWSSKTPEEVSAMQEARRNARAKPRGLGRLRRKPIIAAISGQTAGGGCETTLMCEFRLMSRNASLGCPEVNAGILPGGGGTQRMTRLLGISKAMEMLLLGRVVDADEAERIGLVHKAYDYDELLPAAIELAKELAQRPPMAIGHIMECIHEGSQMPLKDGLALEGRLFFELTQTEDAKRIMSAYVEGGQKVNRLADTD
ncbi:MAG: enoyl-CoA hydratase/isomerase family protein [Gammaproteobacteria bacterium]|nr:enoyl-CoA hydratase/isomerase family protein [Gammaproteobacteria bacterium]